MTQVYKRVGTQRKFHHVRAARTSDCGCGDSAQMNDVGENEVQKYVCYDEAINQVLTVTLTLTSTSVVVIMAAVVCNSNVSGRMDIQRPVGTSVVDQEVILTFGGDGCDEEPYLWELEACEELPAGTYTWTLFAQETTNIYATWLKAHAVV